MSLRNPFYFERRWPAHLYLFFGPGDFFSLCIPVHRLTPVFQLIRRIFIWRIKQRTTASCFIFVIFIPKHFLNLFRVHWKQEEKQKATLRKPTILPPDITTLCLPHIFLSTFCPLTCPLPYCELTALTANTLPSQSFHPSLHLPVHNLV